MRRITRHLRSALLLPAILAVVVSCGRRDYETELALDEPLAHAVFALSGWPSAGDLNVEEWARYMDAARLVQTRDPALVEHLFKVSAGRPNGLGATDTHMFLLMRVVFDLPENAAKPGKPFLALPNAGDARNPDGTFNLAWPIAWNGGAPRIVSPCRGGSGPPYRPDEEFRYLRKRYRFRALPTAEPAPDPWEPDAYPDLERAAAVSSSDSLFTGAMRVPGGFRAAPGAGPEPYSGTGWAREVVHEKTGIEMVFVPAGSFVMGAPWSPEYGFPGNVESPQHRVILTRPFYMGKCEVTQGQWQALMGTTVAQQREKAAIKWPPAGEGDRYPVYYVSWDECGEFLRKAGDGLRLPTEAEWEYACKSVGGPYGGGSLEDAVWCRQTSGGTTHPVGRLRPNDWGLYDMLGNVNEWCSDWQALGYPSATLTDPTGPQTGIYRAARGLGYRVSDGNMSPSARDGYEPYVRNDSTGFRAALSCP